MITILGIHDGHNSGATILQDGQIKYSISEERLTRKKNEIGYPKLSIEEVLKLANIDSQKLIYTPKTTASIEDSSIAKQVLKLFTVLDDYDDSQSVYGNFDISNQLMAEIEL